MESPRPKNDLHQLVDALVGGKADGVVIDELSRLLRDDAAARRAYVEFMCIEAELNSVFHPHTASTSTVPAVAHSESSLQPHTPTLANIRRRPTQWFAIVASLLVAAGGSSWLTHKYTRDPLPDVAILSGDGSTQPLDSPVGDVLAQITGTQNCRWRRDGIKSDVDYGDTIRAFERLELETGLAEITFSSGVRVVLEGPASFRVPGDFGVDLLTGRMSAAVPRDAAGFTVRAPRLSINDSGTQFGLVANEMSGTEVHVFEGPVRARAIDANGQEFSSIRLVASESARIGPQAAEFAVFHSNGDQFVRTLLPPIGPTGGLLALEEFNYPVGPLAWQNGGFGWAGPWSDIEIGGEEADIDGALSNGVAEGSLAACEVISQGNRAQQIGLANRVRRALSTSFCGVFDSAGLVENQDGTRLIGHANTTLYVSFLQRTSRVHDEFYGFELHRSDGDANRVLCIGNGGAPGTAKYGVNSTFNMLHAPQETYFLPLGTEDTDAHLFVIRIDFGDDNRDLVTIYRDPASLTSEEKCVVTAKLRGNFAFDRVSLANYKGTNKSHEVDEIRMGTTFSAVTTGQQSSVRNRLDMTIVPREFRSVETQVNLFTQSPLQNPVVGSLSSARRLPLSL